MTSTSNTWLNSHRERLIAKGRVLVATSLAKQFLADFFVLACVFLLLKEWWS